MPRKTVSGQNREEPRLGQLKPLYNFFLNPYVDVRFTSACPGCSGKTPNNENSHWPSLLRIGAWSSSIKLAATVRIVSF